MQISTTHFVSVSVYVCVDIMNVGNIAGLSDIRFPKL